MAKKAPRKTVEEPCLVALAHGSAWKAMEWYVPFVDGNAIIHHEHDEINDHSKCGPEIFCCPKAAYIFLKQFPEAAPAHTEWSFNTGKFLLSWLTDQGPKHYYFFLCNPYESAEVRFAHVALPELRDVLVKRRSLTSYIDGAPVIRDGGYYAREDE